MLSSKGKVSHRLAHRALIAMVYDGTLAKSTTHISRVQGTRGLAGRRLRYGVGRMRLDILKARKIGGACRTMSRDARLYKPWYAAIGYTRFCVLDYVFEAGTQTHFT